MVQRCTDALRWACRLVPFSRFLKAEEVLQDLVLSLVSELPPVPMVTVAFLKTEHDLKWEQASLVQYGTVDSVQQVVDVLAQVFPEEEESVQVSLREKYNALLQRLRHCTLPGNGFLHAGETYWKLTRQISDCPHHSVNTAAVQNDVVCHTSCFDWRFYSMKCMTLA